MDLEEVPNAGTFIIIRASSSLLGRGGALALLGHHPVSTVSRLMGHNSMEGPWFRICLADKHTSVLIICWQFTRLCNILLIHDVVDPDHVAIVNVSDVDDTSDEHDDIGTHDVMVLVV